MRKQFLFDVVPKGSDRNLVFILEKAIREWENNAHQLK